MKSLIFILFFALSAVANENLVELPSADLSNEDFKRLKTAIEKKSESNKLKAISIILSKDEKNLKALNVLGVHHFNKNRVGLARLIFERALKSHPKEPSLHNNLGVVALAENNIRKAILSFEKAISIRSSYAFAATNISSIYLDYGHSKKAVDPLEDAYDDIRRDLSRGSSIAAEVASNYAVALMGVGKPQRAQKIYENIMSGSTQNINVMLNHAILLVRVLKDKKNAIRALSKIKFISEDRKVLKLVSELERELNKNG